MFGNKTTVISVGLGICLVIVAALAYSQISSLQANASSLDHDKEYLQNQLEQALSENTDLQNQVAVLSGQLDNLQDQVTQLQSQVSSLTGQVNTLNADKAALQTELRDVRITVTGLNLRLMSSLNVISDHAQRTIA
jgi:chromosome segregation ATPase